MSGLTYTIQENKKYIIYGAGGDGIKLFKVLQDAGVEIWGYIDARGESLGLVNGCRAYTLQKASELICDKENYIVILTTKNLFGHSQIARSLAVEGFSQCIYMPAEVLRGLGDDAQKKIGEAYDRLISGKVLPLGMEVKKTDAELKICCKDNFLIVSNSNRVTVWLPEELIYNYDDLEDAYGRVNMPAFFPLVELYRLFMGQYQDEGKICESLDNFIYYSMEWMKKNQVKLNDELEKSLVCSRSNVFSEMQRLFETDVDFFVRSAPSVSRGENGAFYMSSSGRNRIAFLIARGYRFVPVRMSNDDYKSWVNGQVYQEVVEYMQREGKEILECPVPHPFLSSLSVKYSEYIHSFCVKCLNIITKQLFEQSRVKEDDLCVIDKEALDNGRKSQKIGCCLLDDGCMRRYLSMNGLVARSVATGKDNVSVEMEEMLDRLLGQCHDGQKAKSKEEMEYHTIIIADSRRWSCVLAERLDNVHHIFLLNWERGGDCLQDCVRWGFVLQEKLFASLWDGKHVEGYWLQKGIGGGTWSREDMYSDQVE